MPKVTPESWRLSPGPDCARRWFGRAGIARSLRAPPQLRHLELEDRRQAHCHLLSESCGDSAATCQALDRVDPASPYLASGALDAPPKPPTLEFLGPRLFSNSSFTLSQAG